MFRYLKTALLLSIAFTVSAEEFNVRINKEYSQNLLKNPDFELLDNSGKPDGWTFDNCSASKNLEPGVTQEGAIGKNSIIVKTAGHLFGYWKQTVPVKEGQNYCALIKFKLNSKGLLWIKTPQYDDKKSPLHTPKSSTQIYAKAYPEHGEYFRKIMSDFIDPFYIQPVSDKEWNTFSLEFTVPEGHGIDMYEFRAGAYGGGRGWVMADDAYFGLAECTAHIEIEGKIKNIKVKNLEGKIFLDKNVNQESDINKFDVTLPSMLDRYYIEIKDNQGNISKRDI